MSDMEFKDLLDQLQPALVSPHLGELSTYKREKLLKESAKLVVKGLVEQYNKDDSYKTPRVIAHDGALHEVRFLDPTPLYTGIWSALSLVLLHLSYGEQVTLIEALYPEPIQFSAKAFAAVFQQTKPDDPPTVISPDVSVSDRIESTNAGIAMIIAILRKHGLPLAHPDATKEAREQMEQLVRDQEIAKAYKKHAKRSQDRFKKQDELRR